MVTVETLSAFPAPDQADQTSSVVNGDPLSHAIEEAERYSSWYRTKKNEKKKWALRLRAVALAFGACGAVFPIVGPILGLRESNTGYVFLALAAVFVAVDKVFGVSNSWIRFMKSAQAIDSALVLFRHDVMALGAVRDVQSAAMARTREFLVRVDEIVSSETTQWGDDYQSSTRLLDRPIRASGEVGLSGSS